jgi:hypothetical protein
MMWFVQYVLRSGTSVVIDPVIFHCHDVTTETAMKAYERKFPGRIALAAKPYQEDFRK